MQTQPMAVASRNTTTGARIVSAILASMGTVALGVTVASPPAEARSVTFQLDIPAQDLDSALQELALASQHKLFYRAEVVEGKAAPALKGEYTTEEAVRLLLEGTSLTYEITPSSVVLIKDRNGVGAMLPEGSKPMRLAQAEGSSSTAEETKSRKEVANLEEVVVEGYLAPVTVGGKVEQSLRSLPQSISVLTRQRLEEQNISTLPEAMKYTTGITVIRFDGAENNSSYYSRGYAADSFRLDGMSLRNNGSHNAALDMSIFDRIEVLRGPAGLFQGTGEPGVTINLVRKRALKSAQVSTMLGVGTRSAYRGEVDATGPLSDSGRVRGRAVAVYDDRDSYLDGVDSSKKLIYGTLELDLSESSTISIGGTYQDSQAVSDYGLPTLADGTFLDLPRSTSLGADWNLQDMQTTDGFAELETRFSNNRLLKIAVRRHVADAVTGLAYPTGVTTDDLVMMGYFAGDRRQANTTVDVFFDMPFTLGGHSHNLLVGADYLDEKVAQISMWPSEAEWTAGNVYSFNRDIARPQFDNRDDWYPDSEEYGVYGRLTLRPMDRLSILLGGRMSTWKAVSNDYFLGELFHEEWSVKSKFTPYLGMVFDLTSSVSLYASYTDIFTPQTNLTFTGETIGPRSGNQYEAGLKGEFLDQRLNASVAVFRLMDENRALFDPEHLNYYVSAGKARSQGVETEINGNLTPSWSVGGGYTYNPTKILEANPGQEGLPINAWTPKHALKLWTHYGFRNGFLPGLEVGGGVRAVSHFASPFGPVEASGYTVFSSQVAYTFAGRHKVALNIDNLLDKKYWEKVSTPARQNYYGAPLTLMLSVRSQF